MKKIDFEAGNRNFKENLSEVKIWDFYEKATEIIRVSKKLIKVIINKIILFKFFVFQLSYPKTSVTLKF